MVKNSSLYWNYYCAPSRDQDQFIDLIIDEAVFLSVPSLALYANKQRRYATAAMS